jgi:DNA-binding LacI/PurR family transcriptional regulator
VTDQQRKPNIYDVANLAGVSHQTVSRVINNGPYTKESTREKVLIAMQELGYIPNAAARALVTSKSKIVGILVSDTVYNGPAGMLHAMETEARRGGYFAISASVDPFDDESISQGIEHLRQVGIEGLVVITPQSSSVRAVESSVTSIPVVYIDSPNRGRKFSAELDNAGGAKKATEHLISLGHKKILHVSGPLSWFDAPPRVRGYEQAMKEAKLKPLVIEGDWSVATGYEIGKNLELDKSKITAIFAANDHLALGLSKALRQRGIRIPERVSLIGFDDLPESAYFEPPLTTMRPDFAELGRIAMEMILGRIESGKAVKSSSLVPELLVRESTARPPKL